MKYITKSFLWERVLSVRIIIPLRGQIWAFSELSKRSHVQANYATLSLSFFVFVFSSAAWSKSPPDFHISVRHPSPVLLPGKSHRWRSLVDCSPWGSRRVGLDWATSLSLFTFIHWRRKWQPTPMFLPGESQGLGSLVGCHLWGCTESDTTEVT